MFFHNFAREAAAADHALRAVAGAGAQPAVGGDEPERPGVLGRLAGDPVVGRLAALEDDDRVDALTPGPGLDELDQLAPWDVRPDGAPDVLGVDEDRYAARRASISRLTARRSSASASSWRTRSRVSPRRRPISSRDCGSGSPSRP